MADATDPTIVFGEGTSLAVPDVLYQCWGATLLANRDKNGKSGVICNFLMGDPIPVSSGFPTHGELKAAAVMLTPHDARALARELNSFADRAEKS
jgi:hypothetical protein